MMIYKVGGCVRDRLLGIPSNDIDYVYVCDDTIMSVHDGFDSMKKYLIENKFKIFLITPDCFTIRAKFPEGHLHKGVADFVMSRKEISYDLNTRKPKIKIGTLKDDLERRDFTVNAMAEEDDGGDVVIDYFNGKNDLKNRILKTPKNPVISMLDDPLRILRGIRFCITKNFKMDVHLLQCMKQRNVIDKFFRVVSIDRMREELTKSFRHDTVKTILFLQQIFTTNDLDKIFDNMWLLPTCKNK